MKACQIVAATVLVLSVLTEAPVLAASPEVKIAPPAAAIPDNKKVLCDQLALVLAPDTMVPIHIDRLLGPMMESMERDDPDVAAMEEEYPGLKQAAIAGVRPVVVRHSLSMMGSYRADLAKMYCANMTSAELSSAFGFFTSPDGRVLLSTLNGNASYSRATAAGMADRDASAADLKADKQTAARRTISQLTPGQRQRISAFFATPTGRKLIALGPQKNSIEQKWYNFSTPEMEQEIVDATAQAMIAHVAKTDLEAAARMQRGFEAQGVTTKRN